MNYELKRGYIALYTVVIILAVSLVIASTVTILSIGEAQSGYSLFKGEQKLSMTDGCMEHALLLAREDENYSGGTITQPESTCTITIISKVGQTWTINATTTDTDYTRTVQTVITRAATGVTVSSWKEI